MYRDTTILSVLGNVLTKASSLSFSDEQKEYMNGIPHNITEIKIIYYKFWDFKILLNVIKQCVHFLSFSNVL